MVRGSPCGQASVGVTPKSPAVTRRGLAAAPGTAPKGAGFTPRASPPGSPKPTPRSVGSSRPVGLAARELFDDFRRVAPSPAQSSRAVRKSYVAHPDVSAATDSHSSTAFEFDASGDWPDDDEELVKDIYRRHARHFFDELRTWFTDEARSLRRGFETRLHDISEKGVDDDVKDHFKEIESLRERVERLETVAGPCNSAPSSGDAAAGFCHVDAAAGPAVPACSSFDTANSSSSLRALYREESERMLDQVRSEIDALRDVVKHGATAQISNLDHALRASLMSEVRDLGAICEFARAQVTNIDKRVNEHEQQLTLVSSRLDCLEDRGTESKSWASPDLRPAGSHLLARSTATPPVVRLPESLDPDSVRRDVRNSLAAPVSGLGAALSQRSPQTDYRSIPDVCSVVSVDWPTISVSGSVKVSTDTMRAPSTPPRKHIPPAKYALSPSAKSRSPCGGG